MRIYSLFFVIFAFIVSPVSADISVTLDGLSGVFDKSADEAEKEAEDTIFYVPKRSAQDRQKDVCYQLPAGSDAQTACLGEHIMAIRNDRARNIMLGNCLSLGSSKSSSNLSYVCKNGPPACLTLDDGDAAYHCKQCGATRRWLAVYSLGHTIRCF